MTGDQMHGHWREMKGWALENWGRVVQDPWMRIAGRRERLLGRLEASLAQSRHIAERALPFRNKGRANSERRSATR